MSMQIEVLHATGTDGSRADRLAQIQLQPLPQLQPEGTIPEPARALQAHRVGPHAGHGRVVLGRSMSKLGLA